MIAFAICKTEGCAGIPPQEGRQHGRQIAKYCTKQSKTFKIIYSNCIEFQSTSNRPKGPNFQTFNLFEWFPF